MHLAIAMPNLADGLDEVAIDELSRRMKPPSVPHRIQRRFSCRFFGRPHSCV